MAYRYIDGYYAKPESVLRDSIPFRSELNTDEDSSRKHSNVSVWSEQVHHRCDPAKLPNCNSQGLHWNCWPTSGFWLDTPAFDLEAYYFECIMSISRPERFEQISSWRVSMKTCRYCFNSQRVVKVAGTPGIHACGSRDRVSQRQSSSTMQLATVKAKLPRSCLRACVKTTRILERWPRRATDDEIFVSLNEYCKYTEQRTTRPLNTPISPVVRAALVPGPQFDSAKRRNMFVC